MDEDPSKVLVVFFDAVIEGFDVRFVEETENFFLKLPAAFAGDDLHEGDLLTNRFIDNAVEFLIEGAAVVVDVVEVEFEFGHTRIIRR